MRKMKGSGNYLKNQVRENLAKAVLCLLIFSLIFIASSLQALFILSLSFFVKAGLLVSLVALIGFYYYLRKYHIYSGGWEGEKQVIRLLESKLSDDYILLNDLHLRGGSGDIDQVVLGPNGIFVLETKNWNGKITCNGDLWQRSGKPDFKGSPSRQVRRNVATIKQIIDSTPTLGSLGIYIEGIVVFTNIRATIHLNNPTVTIVKLHQLSDQIITHRSSSNYSRNLLDAIGKEILKQKR
jgi:hypothetical protein